MKKFEFLLSSSGVPLLEEKKLVTKSRVCEDGNSKNGTRDRPLDLET